MHDQCEKRLLPVLEPHPQKLPSGLYSPSSPWLSCPCRNEPIQSWKTAKTDDVVLTPEQASFNLCPQTYSPIIRFLFYCSSYSGNKLLISYLQQQEGNGATHKSGCFHGCSRFASSFVVRLFCELWIVLTDFPWGQGPVKISAARTCRPCSVAGNLPKWPLAVFEAPPLFPSYATRILDSVALTVDLRGLVAGSGSCCLAPVPDSLRFWTGPLTSRWLHHPSDSVSCCRRMLTTTSLLRIESI